jgi:hypothetical protein
LPRVPAFEAGRAIETETVERASKRDVIVELDQPPRHPRLLGEFDQRLPPLLLLDLGRTLEQRLEVAVLADQLRGGFDPDAGHARHVVGGVADQRLHLRHLRGRDPEFFHHEGFVDPPLVPRHGIEHRDPRPDQLHQILVTGDDRGVGSRLERDARVGRDQVVGLKTFLLDRDQAEGPYRIPHQWELRNELVRRVGPMALVVGIDLVAEALGGVVEDHRHVGGLHAVEPLAQQLPEHVGEGQHAADRLAVGAGKAAAARLRGLEHGEIGAEHVRRPVDQEDVVAFA